MELLKNNGYFFNQLMRKRSFENDAKNTRRPSLVNTYQNEPEFQKVQNLSRNYMRVGNQKFADPFLKKSRPYYNDYDGRKLEMLKTLIFNANNDKPDVITNNPLKVVGYY